VSTQAYILLLAQELRGQASSHHGVISHDLSVVRVLCDDVAILHHGEVVEYGPVARIFGSAACLHATAALCDPITRRRAGLVRRSQPDCAFPPARISRMTETIKGSVVLITGHWRDRAGADRRACGRGAAKIYAAARDISVLAASPQLVPIKMDVTSDEDVAKAASIATESHALDQQCWREPHTSS